MNEQLSKELHRAMREALGELARKNEALEALVDVIRGEIKKLKSELSSVKAAKSGRVPMFLSY